MKKLEKFINDELNLEAAKFLPLFEEYEKRLLEWNSKINLVSRNTESIEAHILNSIFFLSKAALSGIGTLGDIGTGGGFPGIPLKIIYPEIKVTLIDSIRKKCLAVQSIVSEMNLSGIETVCSRAEELSSEPARKGSFEAITAKAVAPLSKLFTWSKRLTAKTGKMIFIKGGDTSEELRDLLKVSKGFEVNEVNFKFDEIYGIDQKKIILITNT